MLCKDKELDPNVVVMLRLASMMFESGKKIQHYRGLCLPPPHARVHPVPKSSAQEMLSKGLDPGGLRGPTAAAVGVDVISAMLKSCQ